MTDVEPYVDFLLLPGDNEFSAECDGWTSSATDGDTDPVQSLWRSFFTVAYFEGLDKTEPVWGFPSFHRQDSYPENFFMYYSEPKNLAFFGITEPAGDSQYNKINADFIQTELSNLAALPSAIVIFGHATLETGHDVLDVLANYSEVPMLYVMGNDHKYNMDFMAPSTHPKLMQLTVEAFKSGPLLVSIVEEDGEKYFHVETTDYSC